MPVRWTKLEPNATMEHLGFIVMMLDERNPDPAIKQLDAGYRHGGGYSPFHGFAIMDPGTMTIQYPGDPPMRPLWKTDLHGEQVFVYPYAWVLVLHDSKTGKFSIARMD